MTTTLSRMSMMGRRAWRTMAAASGRRRVAAAVAMAMLLGLVAGVPLLRAAEAGAAAPAGKTADAHDDHAGHDHGPAPATKAAAADAHDDHAGHDHGPAPATRAAAAAHDDHAGHDHGPAPATRAAEAAADDHDDHAGHDHGAEGHEDEGVVTLSDAERRNAGIVVAAAGPGDLATEVRLRGEIALNRDRVVHVIPLVAGVAREIRATEGDAVEAGQVLAVLDSSELAEAKLDYLTKVNEVLCCDLLVPRAKAVHDGTRRLLDFLTGNPPLDSLQAFDAGEAGENLKTLLGAYAELAQARQAFERERGLHQKEITSGQEYFAAKTA
ncbi:MAG: efflux RND transporter periplasmic adaptor subunit, partial [Lentisphaerae bacterium]|nr:efflux RND transporter periplasmic adaptor subunit [Lentisphaerota bacterium]